MERVKIITGFMVGIAVICWLGGFIIFCSEVFHYADLGIASVRMLKEAEPLIQEGRSGVVALTGGRNRIAKALELLKLGKSDRLLISGVKKGTGLDVIAKREDIVIEAGQPIDLGYQATDTVGNAVEVKAWAEQYQMNKLMVVTSFYHIPRSFLELSHAMPENELVFYAVQSPYVLRRWWSSLSSFLFLAAEYTKFLVVYVQYKVLGL